MEEAPLAPGERVIASGEERVVVYDNSQYALMDSHYRIRSAWYKSLTADIARKNLGVTELSDRVDVRIVSGSVLKHDTAMYMVVRSSDYKIWHIVNLHNGIIPVTSYAMYRPDGLAWEDIHQWLTQYYPLDEFEYYGCAPTCLKLYRP